MKKTIFLTALVFACGVSAFAITGKEVVDRYFSVNPAPDFSSTTFKVDTYSKAGKLEDSHTLKQFGRDRNELTETSFEVVKSPSNRGTRLLQSQKKNGSDSRWIYMPSLKTTRKIGVTDGSKSFIGTEFTYNDTSMRDADEDTHELLNENGTVTVGGKTYSCYIVKSVPVVKKHLEFDYRVQYFDKTSMIPVRIEYFNKVDKMTKTMEVTSLSSVTGATGKKHNLRQVAETVNLVTGRRSVLTVLSMECDKSLKDSYFTQQWLSTGK